MRQFFAILVLVLAIVASGGCQANGGTVVRADVQELRFRDYYRTGYPSEYHTYGTYYHWDVADYTHGRGYDRPDYHRGYHPGHGAQPPSVRFDGSSYRYAGQSYR